MRLMAFVVAFSLCCLLLVPAGSPQTSKALLLFAGRDHKTCLACLNCIETSEVSVCNKLGKYGSSLEENSIWNGLGTRFNDIDNALQRVSYDR